MNAKFKFTYMLHKLVSDVSEKVPLDFYTQLNDWCNIFLLT